MFPASQQLKTWRRLCSLHHHYCHYRVFSSSTSRYESGQENSFGCLAENKHTNSTRKDYRCIEGTSNYYKGFYRPPLHSSNPRKVSSGLPQDNHLSDKWQHVSDGGHQETREWNSGQQRDGVSLFSKETFWDNSSGKDLSMRSPEPQEDVANASSSKGPLHHFTKKEGSFGGLNPKCVEPEGDEGDLREEQYQNNKLERKHSPYFYGLRMKKLCKEKKLAEAIKILEVEMPAAGTKPVSFCYQVVINACGRAGYTKKAFQLYNQMKRRGLKVEPVAYTGLFLACAHSPWPTTDGLKRAAHLRSHLQEQGYQFNQIISHAMIKAFGWCGDINTAFQVVDDMIQDGLLVTTETMSFLLQACITNKEVGFRYAVKVWRKMRELKLLPNIHTYNLLIRVIKECGAGDPSLTTDLLREERDPKYFSNTASLRSKHNTEIVDTKMKSLDSAENVRKSPEDSAVHPSDNCVVLNHVNQSLDKVILPNVIGHKMTAGSVVALGPLDNAPDRLALLGGPTGILTQMKKDKVTPDLKTFTQLLESLPPDTQAEQALLESMKNLKLEPDTQFFNMLIKKRNFRHDIVASQEVVTEMQAYHLTPDLITYGCLALGCRTLTTASQLLKDMDASNFRPNLEIMCTLVKNSLVRQDYYLTAAILKEMQQRVIHPNDLLLSMLEQARTKSRNILLEKDDNNIVNQERNKKSAKIYLSTYKTWLKNSKVQLPEHPWTQYS